MKRPSQRANTIKIQQVNLYKIDQSKSILNSSIKSAFSCSSSLLKFQVMSSACSELEIKINRWFNRQWHTDIDNQAWLYMYVIHRPSRTRYFPLFTVLILELCYQPLKIEKSCISNHGGAPDCIHKTIITNPSAWNLSCNEWQLTNTSLMWPFLFYPLHWLNCFLLTKC
jgi:hypothetical protein